MIPLSEIELKIRQNMQILYVQAVDLRGGDHIQVIVVSLDFENKSLVEQHKIIYDIFSDEMKSNQIHALTLKTYTPVQWENIKSNFKSGVEHSI